MGLFPMEFHLKLNLLTVIVSTEIMIISILKGHFIHNQNYLSKLHITMLNIYLIFHSIFYIVELVFSGVIKHYFNMSLHHIGSFINKSCFIDILYTLQ